MEADNPNDVKSKAFSLNQDAIHRLWSSVLSIGNYDQVSTTHLVNEIILQAINVPIDDPFSLVTLHPSTDVVTDSLLEITIHRLIKLKAPKSTGMGINELLELPTYVLKMIIRSIVKLSIQETEMIENITKED